MTEKYKFSELQQAWGIGGTLEVSFNDLFPKPEMDADGKPVPVPIEKAAKRIRDAPVDELRNQRKLKQKRQTGRRVARDSWLAPLRLQPGTLAAEPEPSRDGLRASNKGFLNIDWKDYLTLLRWIGQQRDTGSGKLLPKQMQSVVRRLGFDLSMFRDLVWGFQR